MCIKPACCYVNILCKYPYAKPPRLLCRAVLDVEKEFMEAAKRNDVETMKTLGKGLNANAKNVVGLIRKISILYRRY